MPAASWFSNPPDKQETQTPKKPQSKRILNKAVWRATLATNECDRQNQKRPSRHRCFVAFFFSAHCSLGTFHFFLPLSPRTPRPPVRPPALSTAFTPKANSSSESKFLAAGGSDGNITIAVTQGAGSTADYDRITVTIPATYLAGHPKTFARLMTNLIP
jgi:hypothetical protein